MSTNGTHDGQKCKFNNALNAMNDCDCYEINNQWMWASAVKFAHEKFMAMRNVCQCCTSEAQCQWSMNDTRERIKRLL